MSDCERTEYAGKKASAISCEATMVYSYVSGNCLIGLVWEISGRSRESVKSWKIMDPAQKPRARARSIMIAWNFFFFFFPGRGLNLSVPTSRFARTQPYKRNDRRTFCRTLRMDCAERAATAMRLRLFYASHWSTIFERENRTLRQSGEQEIHDAIT